ncbi:hypothetical protein B0H13DRAFT_2364456 [Mycena leptocephala]|nr:hypothetical protein B0H13DRAFT_2364456 [Mycena leptocephala]
MGATQAGYDVAHVGRAIPAVWVAPGYSFVLLFSHHFALACIGRGRTLIHMHLPRNRSRSRFWSRTPHPVPQRIHRTRTVPSGTQALREDGRSGGAGEHTSLTLLPLLSLTLLYDSSIQPVPIPTSQNAVEALAAFMRAVISRPRRPPRFSRIPSDILCTYLLPNGDFDLLLLLLFLYRFLSSPSSLQLFSTMFLFPFDTLPFPPLNLRMIISVVFLSPSRFGERKTIGI